MEICTLTYTLYLNSLKLPPIKRLAIFLVQDIQKIRMTRGSRVSRKRRPLENLHGVLWSRNRRRTIYKFRHNPAGAPYTKSPVTSQRSTEPTIYRTNEPTIHRTNDLSNQRTTEPKIHRTNDLSNQRSTEPTIYRTNDLSNQRSIGPTIYRTNDPPKQRSIELTSRRSVRLPIISLSLRSDVTGDLVYGAPAHNPLPVLAEVSCNRKTKR